MVNYIILAFLAAVLSAFLAFLFPQRINAVSADPMQDRPIFWVDIGTFALFVGAFFLFRYIWNFQNLSRKMTKYERGMPFEKVFEEELSQESE